MKRISSIIELGTPQKFPERSVAAFGGLNLPLLPPMVLEHLIEHLITWRQVVGGPGRSANAGITCYKELWFEIVVV